MENKGKNEYKQGREIDWNEFFVLKPQKSRLNERKIIISDKNEIRLNSGLQNAIQSRNIELIFSKNYKLVLLNPEQENGHKFTKAGITKNREIVEMFRKLKIPFPVTYIVEWDEEYQMWKGELKTESKK